MRNMKIDGQEVLFQRPDGTLAEFDVGVAGTGKNGEVLFYEILDKIDSPKINGKAKFKRILIQQVYPVIKNPELLEEK